jgi:hypothetical protein
MQARSCFVFLLKSIKKLSEGVSTNTFSSKCGISGLAELGASFERGKFHHDLSMILEALP